jgi:hypothetical protein
MKTMFQLAAWFNGVYYYTKLRVKFGKKDNWFLQWPVW